MFKLKLAVLVLMAQELGITLTETVGTGRNKRNTTFIEKIAQIKGALLAQYVNATDNSPLPENEINDEFKLFIEKFIPNCNATLENFFANVVEDDGTHDDGGGQNVTEEKGYTVLVGKAGRNKGVRVKYKLAEEANMIPINDRLCRIVSARLVAAKTSTDARIVVFAFIPKGGSLTETEEFQLNESYLATIPCVRLFGKDFISKVAAHKENDGVMPLNILANLTGYKKVKNSTTIVSRDPQAFVDAEKANIKARGQVYDSATGKNVEGILLYDTANVPFSFDRLGKPVTEEAKAAFEQWTKDAQTKASKLVVETEFQQDAELLDADHRQHNIDVLKKDAKNKAEIEFAGIDKKAESMKTLMDKGFTFEQARAIVFA